MWRKLDDIANNISEENWPKFRKHRFSVRVKFERGDEDAFSDCKADKYSGYVSGLRLGKISKGVGCINYTYVVVPIKRPGAWFSTSPNKIEVFISDDDLIKIFAITMKGL